MIFFVAILLKLCLKCFIDSGVDLRFRTIWLSENATFDRKEIAENCFVATENVMQKLSGFKTATAVEVRHYEKTEQRKFVLLDDCGGGLSKKASKMELKSRAGSGWHSGLNQFRLVDVDVQDPGNLGSLLRTCTCLGWRPVLLLPNCCDPFNEKVIQAAKGATFSLPILPTTYDALDDVLQSKELIPIGAVAHSGNFNILIFKSCALEDGDDPENVLQNVKGQGVCLVLGNEGQGLSDEIRQRCRSLVSIPQTSLIDSLNVSVAGGILMYILNPPQNKSKEARIDPL